MKDILYHFMVIYCLFKNLMGIAPQFVKKSSFLVGLLTQTCLITLSIITMLTFAILLLPIQFFLLGMDFWLMWKLGNNYGGRLKGQDVLMDVEEEKVTMSALIILNHDEDLTILNKRLQEFFKSIHNSSNKFSCTVEKCLGYAYYVKNQVTFNDCCIFTNVNDKEYLTRHELFEYIQKNCMVNVCNRKRLWYGTIFTQPVLWNKQNKTKKQIALILTFRHCLADAPSLIGLLKYFVTVEEKHKLMKIDRKYTTRPTFILDDAYIYRNVFTSGRDEPTFEIPNNERCIAFYAEDDIKYVPLIKKLKNILRIRFTDILIGGLTASLSNVLAKRGKTLDKCTTAVTARHIDEDLDSIINGTYNYNNLANNTSVVIINTHATMRKDATMVDWFKSVGIELAKVKCSVDSLLSTSFSKIAHFLPASVLKYLSVFTDITIGASNVGGLNIVAIAGCEVEAVMPFAPCFYKTNFVLAIFSQHDRLQLALTTRENVMYSRKEAQEVIDNIFTFIDNLSEELNIQLNCP